MLFFDKFQAVVETFFEVEVGECKRDTTPAAHSPTVYSFRDVKINENIIFSKNGDEASRHFDVSAPNKEFEKVSSFDEALKLALSAQMEIQIQSAIEELNSPEDEEEYVGEPLEYKKFEINYSGYELTDMTGEQFVNSKFSSGDSLYATSENIPVKEVSRGVINIGSEWERDIDGAIVTVTSIHNEDTLEDCVITYTDEDGEESSDSADEFLEIYSQPSDDEDEDEDEDEDSDE